MQMQINACILDIYMVKGAPQQKGMKHTVLKQLRALRPPPNATPQQKIQCLVRQAEHYTSFLLSRHEKPKGGKSVVQSKRRGHFSSSQDELQICEEEMLTRLTEQPPILKGGTLKYYQLVGLNWMINLYESGISGVLADDMGLGKTIQTIAMLGFLKQYKETVGPHLIIAPKSTLWNWVAEFQKWLPCCRVVKLIATRDEREDILANVIEPGHFDVIITSFEGVRICLSHLKKIKWKYVVIDEAHKIKNEESQLSQDVRKLTTACKLLLTGTPLQNNLHELWSLLNFLLPDIFTSSEMFDNWFESTSEKKEGVTESEIEKNNAQMIDHLHKILRPFMLRRTKLEVEKALPPKKEIHLYVGLTTVQLNIYRNLLLTRHASEDEKRQYLNLLMQLRKVCNHPYLFPNIEPPDAPFLGEHIIQVSGKLKVLDKLLAKLKVEGGHKVLIFSQMTMVLDILEDYCIYRSHAYCRIDGSTEMDLRESQIDEFMRSDSQSFIFLLSTRAGGLGINLTAADTVIIYDSDWNPQMDLQAMDRAHRIGQKKLVNVYRLITENTVEEKIVERQKIKLKWDSLVIQQQKHMQKNKTITKEEMKEMLQFGANVIFRATDETITDEKIDIILERGENKTNELIRTMDEKIKAETHNLVDFSMNSINIFDFMQQDEKKKREDEEALNELLARELQSDYRTTRRDKTKLYPQQLKKKQFIKMERKVNVPQYHFYPNRQQLLSLLQRQQDYLTFKNHPQNPYYPLTEEQQERKTQLLSQGHLDWSKADFYCFINACEKYGRHSHEDIAREVNKTIQEIGEYSGVFWSRVDELSDRDKIVKQITSGEERISSRRQHRELLEWKAARCYEIEFNPQVYMKFRSKLYSVEADRYLAQMVHKSNNMGCIKEKIKQQSMFRFDHYFRSRNVSELNKRMNNLYKLIEKERENENYGFDVENKESKKSGKKKRKENNILVPEEEHESEQEGRKRVKINVQ